MFRYNKRSVGRRKIRPDIHFSVKLMKSCYCVTDYFTNMPYVNISMTCHIHYLMYYITKLIFCCELALLADTNFDTLGHCKQRDAIIFI